MKTYSFSLSKHESDVKCLTLKFVVCQFKKKKDTPSASEEEAKPSCWDTTKVQIICK